MVKSDKRKLELLVDEFVAYVNSHDLEPKVDNEIPPDLRLSEDLESHHWKIRSAESSPWLFELTQKLPIAFPLAFSALASRYRFCQFEVGPILFFANTGTKIRDELAIRTWSDKHLFPTLHANRCLQFGKPSTGSYDPVCFDMKAGTREDAPIVQLDHEAILMKERIRVVEEIAPSFESFMRRAVEQKLAVG